MGSIGAKASSKIIKGSYRLASYLMCLISISLEAPSTSPLVSTLSRSSSLSKITS
jgi:hypothetical protein